MCEDDINLLTGYGSIVRNLTTWSCSSLIIKFIEGVGVEKNNVFEQ